MDPFVTIEDAKKQVNLDIEDDYGDLQLKINQASAIVAKYIKIAEYPDSWIVDPSASPVEYEVPFDIQAATMLVTAELFHNREASTANVLSPAVLALLAGHRVPTIA